MIRNSFQRDMMEDPFFAAHRNHMMSMGSMFQMPDPFGSPQIVDARQAERERRSRERQQRQQQQQLISPFGMMPLGLGGMLSNMNRMMTDMHRNLQQPLTSPTGNGANFVQSSFVSYSNVGNGAPRVYQSSVSQRARGGVVETQRTERDTTTGIEKVQIGHKIGQREHKVEKSRNVRTGENEVNQEFINIDEEEAEKFDKEFQEKVRTPTMPVRGGAEHRRHRINPTESHSHSHGHSHSHVLGHSHGHSHTRPHTSPASTSTTATTTTGSRTSHISHSRIPRQILPPRTRSHYSYKVTSRK